jgi:hypothetical protein
MLQEHPLVGVEYVDGELVANIVREVPMPSERVAARQQRVQETIEKER